MPGRSSYRPGGRGGRGGRNINRQRAQPTKKKTIEDYYFYVGSSRQASDFEITSEYIINHIKMTFERGNDIAESLNLLQLMDTKKWRPELKGTTEDDPDKKALITRQNEMEYKAELEESMKRARMYENNQYKAYALLWQRCAKAMQNRIEARKDYKKVMCNNPIELLKAIKEHALNYQETRYEMSVISDAMRACLSAKQRENEGLQDYTRRFKTSMEILESHIGGPLQLPKYVKTMDGYDETSPSKKRELANQASEQLFTYIYLENADQKKYGTVLKSLNSQKSLGNDQHPKKLIEAILQAHVCEELFTCLLC